MAKGATLIDVGTGFASNSTLDANFDALNAKFDNTLSLDGSTPNAMGADLDMNSNDILNARSVTTDSLVLGGSSVTSSATTLTAAQTGKLGYDSRNASNAALAAALADGTVVYMAGYPYIVDSTATGTASATNDLSVDGLRVFDSQGINVKQFGATGDGTTDDSTAIQNAWKYAWANTAWSSGGFRLYFPAGDYLITENDVFGTHGTSGQKGYCSIEGPTMGGARIYFKPTTGNSTFSDNEYFLFDGGLGDDVSFNALTLQFVRIRHLRIDLDKTNLTTGDEIWVWRLDGHNASQNIEFHDVRVQGTGSTGTGVNAKSGFLQVVGSINADAITCRTCRFHNMSHVLEQSNPQSVLIYFDACQAWTIYDHFFVVNDGASEIHLNDGGYVWVETPDTTPQYLLHVTSSSSPAASNCMFKANKIKPEMRGSGSRLVYANDTTGTLEANFMATTFAGGGISGDRDVTVLSAGKTVRFNNCLIPDAFGHNFTLPNTARSGQNWSVANLGLVEYHHCTIDGDLSSKITKTGDAGRVIAKDCSGYNNEASPYNQVAVDFDSNPFVTGHKEPQPWLKTVKLVDNSVTWNGDDAFVAILPYNAIIHRVQAIRYAGTGGTSRDLKITDGDAVELATDTSTELAGFDASADISLADNTGLAQKRTTTNKRTITANITTTLTGNNANGIGYIQYW